MKIIEQLKQLQADSIVFFMKVHNYHWNVKGLNFPQIHLATQEIYEEFADVFDDTAERIIQLGGVPYVKIEDCLKGAKIAEEGATKFDAKSVLEGVLKDYEYFEKAFKKLSDEADSQGDKVTGAYADDKLAYIQKKIWFLKAQLG